MLDAKTTALLRTVLEELCASVSPADVSTRTDVAFKLLETANQGRYSTEELKAAGTQVLREPPMHAASLP